MQEEMRGNARKNAHEKVREKMREKYVKIAWKTCEKNNVRIAWDIRPNIGVIFFTNMCRKD